MRLLTRTTRSVAPTEVGERLLRSGGPRVDEIQAELAGLSDLRDRPTGTIRISADEHAASMVLWPALERFLPNYPDIKAEIVVDNGLIDMVAERFDAGVRSGAIIPKDMIAVPIGGQSSTPIDSRARRSSAFAPGKPRRAIEPETSASRNLAHRVSIGWAQIAKGREHV
jgi:DNA-binding transcriptional LysR family regulator